MKATVWASFASATVMSSAPFQNLDFEGASLPPGQAVGLVPSSQAFPGWTASLGTTPVDQVLYNEVTLGSAAMSLARGPSIQGDYMAFFIPGFFDPAQALVGASLAQSGLVPADTKSIRFSAAPGGFPHTLDVSLSFNGQEISLVPLAQNGSVTLFGGDVSAFAGGNAEMRFTVDFGDNEAYLDAILFSPLPVPEPSTWALLGTGLLCLAGYIRKQARR